MSDVTKLGLYGVTKREVCLVSRRKRSVSSNGERESRLREVNSAASWVRSRADSRVEEGGGNSLSVEEGVEVHLDRLSRQLSVGTLLIVSGLVRRGREDIISKVGGKMGALVMRKGELRGKGRWGGELKAVRSDLGG